MLTHLVCLKTYFCVSGGHISEIQGAFQVVIQPLTQNVSAQPDSHIGAGRTMQTKHMLGAPRLRGHQVAIYAKKK